MYSPAWILDFILYEIVVQVEYQGVDASAYDEPLAAALEGASLYGGGPHGSLVELFGATGSKVAAEGGARPPSTGTSSTFASPKAPIDPDGGSDDPMDVPVVVAAAERPAVPTATNAASFCRCSSCSGS